jgi:hypothetical protein
MQPSTIRTAQRPGLWHAFSATSEKRMKPTSQSDYTKRIERVIAAVVESVEQGRDLPSTATLTSIAKYPQHPPFLGGNGTYPASSRCTATARFDRVGHSLDSRIRGTIVRAMPVTPEELAQKAMELTTEGRAELADLLVESLGTAQLGKIDRDWLAEAKRRRDEVRSGRATTIQASEALRQVRDALKQ